jgi:hypothetical protein
MDEDRRIRFLIPPVLFLASLLWGVWSDQTTLDSMVRSLEWERFDWPKLIGLIAGGSVVVVAAGYVFGTVVEFVLRLLVPCLFFGKHLFHEVVLSKDGLERVWRRLDAPGEPTREQELYAGAAFDHHILRKDFEGIHDWLFRRCSAFNVAANSLCALVLSFLFGISVLGIPVRPAWWVPAAVFATLLVFAAHWAWRDTMKMLDFMAKLPQKQA